MAGAFRPYSPTNPLNPDVPFDLVAALLSPTSGLGDPFSVLSNISVTTSILSTHFYDGSITQLGIGPGLLLTTGTEPGPTNSVSNFSASNGFPGDADLSAVVPGKASFNAATLSFTLANNNPSVTGFKFNVVFGSEEFPEFVDSFPDIGAVFVNGVNVALFNNNPAQPLSVLRTNLDAGNFQSNTANAVAPIEYDGLSTSLTIIAPLNQGVNTIKIGIADLGDTALDSGMFIANLQAVTTGGDGGLLVDVPGTDENDTITGGDNNELIEAGDGDDSANGGGGDDFLFGEEGDDTLAGGAGDDEVQGNGGVDKAVFSGNKADYEITYDETTGFLTVKDLREGSPDGTDFVENTTEFLVFADGECPISDFVADAPVADNDAYMTAFNTALNVAAATGVLNGDTDADGDTLTAAVVSGPTNGTVTLNPDGSFEYIPNVGFSGSDSFTYMANDGASDSNVATVTITVKPETPPVGDITSILGTPGDDAALNGGDGRERILGRAGNDSIDGGGGNDTVNGAQGNDTLTGGSGGDQFRIDAREIEGGSDTETITDLDFAEGDVIALTEFAPGTFGNEAGGNPLLTPGGGKSAILDSFADLVELDDESPSVSFSRLGLTDTLVLEVVDGDGDVQQVLINDAVADFLAAGGTLAIPGLPSSPPAGANVVPSTAGPDNLLGTSDVDWIDAGAGNDQLLARAGNDTLIGGVGNDTLNGAQDDDLLFGGADADQFRFDAREIAGGSDTDTVLDLTFAEGDTLVLASFGAGVLQGVAGGNPLQIVGAGVAAILNSYEDIAELAAASAGVTTSQAGATDTLVLSVTDTDGDVLNIQIANGFAAYLAAGGVAGI